MVLSLGTEEAKKFLVGLLSKNYNDTANSIASYIYFNDLGILYIKGAITAEIGLTVSPKGELIIDLTTVKAIGFSGFGVFRKIAGDLIIKKLKKFPGLFETVEKKKGNIYIKVKFIELGFIDVISDKITISFRLCLKDLP